MFPTGLKIFGTATCSPWCSISFPFQNSLKDVWASRLWDSWVLLLEFGPILTRYRFPATEEFVVIFRLMMCQMFSIGERSILQAGQFSTQSLLQLSHAFVIAAVCGFALSCRNTQGLPWNRCHLEGSTRRSKTFIYNIGSCDLKVFWKACRDGQDDLGRKMI